MRLLRWLRDYPMRRRVRRRWRAWGDYLERQAQEQPERVPVDVRRRFLWERGKQR